MVSPLADGRTWVIRSEFGYDVGAEGSGDRIDVPIGFKTDFASVPRLFWAIFPQWGYKNVDVDDSYVKREVFCLALTTNEIVVTKYALLNNGETERWYKLIGNQNINSTRKMQKGKTEEKISDQVSEDMLFGYALKLSESLMPY